MLSTRQDTRKYTAKIFNKSTNTDITEYVDSVDISMPKSTEISSLVAKFSSLEPLALKGNEIEISVLDEVGSVIYLLSGEATISNVEHNYRGTSTYTYEVKEGYNKLFEKVIAITEVFYDLYVSNTNDTENSLMHIIAKKLGFNNFDFQDAKYKTGQFIRIPFVIFREGDRWIDELQTLMAATGSNISIFNKKLVFKPRNFEVNRDLELNVDNIIANVTKREISTNNNGIRVLYDRYQKLDNQVVFNLASKVIVNENTRKDTEVQTMKIEYITSSVADPVITKATGYYFTRSDVSSKVDVQLQSGTDYILEEFSNTGVKVKFYNDRAYKLYIDNFEIKGRPLVQYTDNEAVIKDSDVLEKNQENFKSVAKNKYVQTLELAEHLANQEYIDQIKSTNEYTLDTYFLPGLQVGGIYVLRIKEIDTIASLDSITMLLRTADFRYRLKMHDAVLDYTTKSSSTDSLNPNTQFIDLKPLEEKIEDNAKNVKEVTQKVQSKLHVSETEPTENVEEHDIWLKESSNTFKIYLNSRWSNIAESDLLPAIKHYNSLRKAELEIGKVNDRAGLFLLNGDEKFGAINGILAEVSIDKKGTVKMGNVNNLLEWNVKDHARPDKVRSKLYMGVTDVSTIPDNVYFKIGDDSNGFSLEFKDGEVGKAKINGVELGEKLRTDKAEIDKKITNLSKANAELSKEVKTAKSAAVEESKTYINNKKTDIDREIQNLSRADGQLSAEIRSAKEYANTKKTEAVNESKNYINDKKSEIDRNINNLSQADAQLSKDINNAKSEVKGYADTKKKEAVSESKGYVDGKKAEIDRNINNLSQTDAQLSRDIKSAKDEAIKDSKSYADTKKTEIENVLKKEITFEVGGEDNKYYPVYITSHRKLSILTIYRNYHENAPESWNNSKTHHGALNLQIQTRFGTNWDGNPTDIQVIKFSETYTSIVSKIQMTVYGMFVWLRGGGAVYHAYTDDYTTNSNLSATVYLNGFRFKDLGGNYAKYYPNEVLPVGTYDETGKAESIKALMTYNRSEIDRQFTNADGKLTTLQGKYNATVQDIESYKTETTANIDTVERALQDGNFKVTGNTVFDGTASFISRGTNERIAISNGSIDFYRTVDGREQRLTRIKNIRYGTIATDSKGKGVVNFEGFKQPMIVMSSIKSANFGKNMASIFCYTEHIRGTQYRFYVGGTNEHYTEAKSVKIMGTSWTASNAVITTLHGITGKIEQTKFTLKKDALRRNYLSPSKYWSKKGGEYDRFTVPEFKVEVLRNNQVVYSKNYKLSHGNRKSANFGTTWLYVDLYGVDISTEIANMVKFNSRTNVEYRIKITIIQPHYTIDHYGVYKTIERDRDGTSTIVWEQRYKGTLFTLTPAHFKNLSITASAETSTLSDTTGTGEVSYIAMEID